MKKKWLILLCAIVACLCAAFAFTACGSNQGGGENNNPPWTNPDDGNHGEEPSTPNEGNEGEQPSNPDDGNEDEQPSNPNDGNEDEQPSNPNDGNQGEEPSNPDDGNEGEQPSNPDDGNQGEQEHAHSYGDWKYNSQTHWKQCVNCSDTIEEGAHTYEENICTVCARDIWHGSEGLEYTLSSDGTYYSVTGIGTCTDTDVIIANSHQEFPVLSIGDRVFYNCSGLTSIVIPDSVTSIGSYAFYGCSGLTKVYYTGTIDEWASKITFSNYHANPLDYAHHLYIDNQEVTEVNLTTAIKVGEYAFSGYSGLTSVTIGNSVTSIGDSAFAYCSGLTEIKFNATAMNDLSGSNNVFFKAGQSGEGITVTIGANVTKIPAYLFYPYSSSLQAPNITSVVFEGESLCTSIGDGAFAYCSGLTGELVIPDGVESIGDGAFAYCSGLTGELVIPDSVESIGSSAFEGCSGLTSITLPFVGETQGGTNNTHFGYIFGASSYYANSSYVPSSLKTVVITGGSGIGDGAFYRCSGLTGELVIPDSVTSIGSYAFYDCDGLTSIVIPDSVESIGSSAFEGCSGLTSITLPFVGETKGGTNNTHFGYIFGASSYYANSSYVPSSLKTVVITGGSGIGDGAFYRCSGLTGELVIPDSVESIGSSAFDDCDGLTSIVIPDSVTSIGDYAFKGCSGLTSIVIPDSVESIGSSAFRYCIGLTGELVIPDSVESIGSSAFEGCSGLTSIVIPDSVESIGSSAFEGCSGLTSIVIPDSVTSIGEEAFRYCIGLTGELVIPDSVESIGEEAFRYCIGLTSVTIGNSVESIGRYAFGDCTALTEIKFNATAMNDLSSGNDVFYNAGQSGEGITVTIGANVTKIPAYLFYPYNSSYAPNITSVVFEEGSVCTSIGNYAFYGCSGLTKVNYSGTIDDWAMIEFGNLTANPLYYAKKLYLNDVEVTEVILTTATKIGSSAFEGCSGLTSVTIGNGVTSIGDGAFYNCTALTEIKFNATAMNDLSRENNVFSYAGQSGEGIAVTIGANVTKIPAYLFWPDYDSSYAPNITSIVFEEGSVCTSIGDYAFYYCSGLTSIVIPDSVESIGGSAFEGCSGLTGELVIPDSVTSIGSYAFSGCSGIIQIENGVSYVDKWAIDCNVFVTSVTLRENTVGIGRQAFSWCDGLTSVVIPDSVTSIGSSAFSGCSGLTSIEVAEGNTVYHSEGNCLIETASNTLILGCYNSVIPDSITSIGDYAFDDCDGLTSIVIPNSVTSIGNSAFYSCSGLTSIVIPDSVTSIGDGAFAYCSCLTGELVIPDSVESIGEEAFNGCSGLTGELVIPDSVESIGSYAFNGCSGLTGELVIPDSVENIGEEAFRYCIGLTSVTIGNSVESIGRYAFGECTALTEIKFNATAMNDLSSNNEVFYKAGQSGEGITVTIGANVTKIPAYLFYPYYFDSSYAPNIKSVVFKEGSVCESIGERAFYYCSGLTSIVIPDSVTSIGDYAFYYCSGLTSVTIGNGVESIGGSAFYECSGLTSIVIPDSVTSIGESAFYRCYGLTSVTFENPNGWYVSKDSTATSGTNLTLTDASTNATYLESTYYNFYWKRK